VGSTVKGIAARSIEDALHRGRRLGPAAEVPDYWTTIVPVMASPWTAQSYWYVPGVVNVKVYVLPLPVKMSLLVNVGASSECTLCGVSPVLLQVQVTVVPAATVSTAGFWVPL
jgi:hypothetical protein